VTFCGFFPILPFLPIHTSHGDMKQPTFRNYEEERVGRRGGDPSERYAQKHPFPGYSDFIKPGPQFMDSSMRMYRVADGTDAEDMYQTYRSTFNPTWDPSDKDNDTPGTIQRLYVALKWGDRTKGVSEFPYPNEELILVHLSTGRTYSVMVSALEGAEYPKAATAAIDVKYIELRGIAGKKTMDVFAHKLPRRHRKIVLSKAGEMEE